MSPRVAVVGTSFRARIHVPAPRRAGFEGGLATMRALEAARRSASLGGQCTAVQTGVAA